MSDTRLMTLAEAATYLGVSMVSLRRWTMYGLKLDRWSEDLKLSLEQDIKDLDKQIRELRRTSALSQSLHDKLAHQKHIRELERHRHTRRRELFDAQDAIDQQREDLICKIERQLQHTTSVLALFVVRWEVH